MFVRKKYVALALALAVIIAIPQLEIVREQERRLAADFVSKGELETAQRVYDVLKFQNDPIGTNNYHALDYYLSINAGDETRKAVSIEAASAWRRTGAAGVGASYWNLAMFDIKYGRAEKKYDASTTFWLQEAANEGIYEAVLLLRAGDGEYDRLKLMMEHGDPGAALTWASEMHFAGNTVEKDRALRIAAKAGSIDAMADLGWSLTNRRNAQLQDAKFWSSMAAFHGHTGAALRLGNCYEYQFYFCNERDMTEAMRWYEIALGPVEKYSLPRIIIDADQAIRLGTMAKWYSFSDGIHQSAAYQLGKLLMQGGEVPKDPNRAMTLLAAAGDLRDAKELLVQLQQEAATE